MARLVKRLTLGFGSVHNLTVCGFEPHIGLCTDSVEPAQESLSLPLPFPCSHALSQNRQINLKKKKGRDHPYAQEEYNPHFSQENTRPCYIGNLKN